MFCLVFVSTPSRADWIAPNETKVADLAFVAGQDAGGRSLYVCRASIEGDAVPGKLIGNSKECIVSSKGKVYRVHEFEVLVGKNYNWVAQYDGEVPFDALPAGRRKSGETLYSCRGAINSMYHPGNIERDSNGCRISHDNNELKALWYEVLVNY